MPEQAAALDARPLTPGFGAEVLGIDLSRPADPSVAEELRDLFARHLVLLFREQRLSEEAQIAFARHFGKLQMPEVSVLSNLGPDGRPTGEHADPSALAWHTDSSYARCPPYASLLYAEAVPAVGGETLFADTLSACEALPQAERASLERLRALHDLAATRRKVGLGRLPRKQRKPRTEHPLLRTHPASGRRGIYLGSHADRIVGLKKEESAAVIERLMAHTTQPRFVYAHTWQPGDLLIWDNRAVLHRATEYDTATERRVMRRSVLKGDEPY